MTKQEADFIGSMNMCDEISNEAYKKIMCHCEVEEQQPCEDCISRQAVLDNAYAYDNGLGAEGYCVNVEDIQELPSVTPQPFINKPCISEGVCHEDKMQTLDKLKAEIEQLPTKTMTNWNGCCPDFNNPEIEYVTKNKLLNIIDKYRSESEE